MTSTAQMAEKQLSKKLENPYKETCKGTEGDIGLAAVSYITKGVSLYTKTPFLYKELWKRANDTESAPIHYNQYITGS